MKIKNGFYLWCITGLFAILPMVSFAQTNKVKGTVTDASTGEALIGASVLVKGTSNGTITDMDGNFVLDLSGQKTLVVSFVGYLSKEVRVAGGTNPKIMLEPDSKVVEELVVIGYGQQKKVTVTGSIVNVTGDDLLKSPTPSLGNAIAGKLPGLSTVQY